MSYTVTHVTFRHPLDGTRTVPLDEAWTFFERENYGFHQETATVRRDGSGETFETFAKGWFVWDFTMDRYRLRRIGLGAYGDGGPTNPNHKLYFDKPSGEWVSGIRRRAS